MTTRIVQSAGFLLTFQLMQEKQQREVFIADAKEAVMRAKGIQPHCKGKVVLKPCIQPHTVVIPDPIPHVNEKKGVRARQYGRRGGQ